MRQILMLFVLLLFTSPALAASGAQGGVSWRGAGVPGLKVRAYRSISDIPLDRPVAVSALTTADGSYQLDLPQGSYYFTARNYEKQPTPGDYFCYFNGGPVRVKRGEYVNVGFNLIRIPQEAPPVAAAASGIRGEVSFQDRRLERVYLYVYKDPADAFKGPGYFIQPVEKGTFALRLPPGDYWLLARKRAKGGQFGPLETGDYFSYYYGNPIHIAPGMVREVKIETIARLSLFDADATASFSGIQGKVVVSSGRPAAGLYVFAYRDAAMTGTPDVFSQQTAADGSFRLPLAEPGPWYLLARENFGGPAVVGELYGRLGGPKGAPVLFDSQVPLHEVVIHVEAKTNP